MYSKSSWSKSLYLYNEQRSQTTSENNPDLVIVTGTRELQGPRPSMEDAASIMMDLEAAGRDLVAREIDCNHDHSFFCAVFDGHKGPFVSRFAAHSVPVKLLESQYLDTDPALAMRDALLKVDEKILECYEDPHLRQQFDAGSTCTSVMLKKGILYCANIGDSRSVLCRNGHPIDLSIDQKPSRTSERLRITRLGGQIHPSLVNSIPFGPDRVWPGGLALSRALGDFDIKKSQGAHIKGLLISSEPELREIPLHETDDFIIIGCDGIWDVFTSQDAVSFVTDHLPIAAAMAYAQANDEDIDMWFIPDSNAIVRGSKEEVSYYGANVVPMKLLPPEVEDDMPASFWECVAGLLAELLIKYAIILYTNDNVTATIVLFKKKGRPLIHPRGACHFIPNQEHGNDSLDVKAAMYVHRELDPAFNDLS